MYDYLKFPKVTAWSKIENKQSLGGGHHDETFHNHIENGWSESDKPSPKFPSQSNWKTMRWKKEYGYLMFNHYYAPKKFHLINIMFHIMHHKYKLSKWY